MAELLTAENVINLGMLMLLQVVLGFDNLLYISIESKRVAADKQQMVRRLGIALAIFLRIALLFILISAIKYFQEPLFAIRLGELLVGEFNGHSLIVFAGGILILYTATKEIHHMLAINHIESHIEKSHSSVAKVVSWIVLMNLVFSFDSILSAIALTNVKTIIAISIVVSGILMIWLADHVAEFLKRNRMYEVLGLFILFIVGMMLLLEGGHLAHLKIAGNEVHPMANSTFYFVIVVLVLIDVAQSRYQKKLTAQRNAELARAEG